jgi:hypothetical protein
MFDEMQLAGSQRRRRRRHGRQTQAKAKPECDARQMTAT